MTYVCFCDGKDGLVLRLGRQLWLRWDRSLLLRWDRSLLLRQERWLASSARQTMAVETGQMSAVGTGRISVVEKGQMTQGVNPLERIVRDESEEQQKKESGTNCRTNQQNKTLVKSPINGSAWMTCLF